MQGGDLASLVASEGLFDDEPSLEGLSQFVDTAWDFMVLGIVASEVAGFCTVHCLPRPDAAREGFIYEIGTRPAFQRRGVAREMIAFARAECARRGVSGLWVITNRSNVAACSLYEACGGFSAADDEVVYEWS
jgi:ribosomal protein S18 acetylase RimI-like enzyme